MKISDETAKLIRQFTDLSVDLESSAGMLKSDWEHARSYAIEALTRLLRDNPERFDYAPRMDAIARERRRKLNTPK